MNEIELLIHDMSSTIQPADAYALVLEEKYGTRKLPIIIGAQEAYSIKIAMTKYKAPRPLTHDLFITLIKKMEVEFTKVLIYLVKDGVFYSYLYLTKDGNEYVIDSRTSDAIALALRYKAPIFTTAEIMDNEHLNEESNGSFSITINMVNIDILRDELNKAIKEENYEQASRIRDEILRREKSSSDAENNNI
jgi:bifunctional DNase/RNase